MSDRNAALNDIAQQMKEVYDMFTVEGKTSMRGTQALLNIVKTTPNELQQDALNRFEGLVRKEEKA